MGSKFLKRLKPSKKPFASLAKANNKLIKRAVPKGFQKPALRATNVMLNSNVFKTSADLLNTQMSGGGIAEHRAALRRYHFNTFLPFDKRTKDLRDTEVMLQSNNWRTRQAGLALRTRVDSATARHGKIGAAVGALFTGGTTGSLVKAAASAVRANPTAADSMEVRNNTWPDPRLVPAVEVQMYRRAPVGAPIYRRDAPGGLLGFLWRLLVPPKKRAEKTGKIVPVPGQSVPGQSGRYGGINPGGTFYTPGGPGSVSPGRSRRVY